MNNLTEEDISFLENKVLTSYSWDNRKNQKLSDSVKNTIENLETNIENQKKKRRKKLIFDVFHGKIAMTSFILSGIGIVGTFLNGDLNACVALHITAALSFLGPTLNITNDYENTDLIKNLKENNNNIKDKKEDIVHLINLVEQKDIRKIDDFILKLNKKYYDISYQEKEVLSEENLSSKIMRNIRKAIGDEGNKVTTEMKNKKTFR